MKKNVNARNNNKNSADVQRIFQFKINVSRTPPPQSQNVNAARCGGSTARLSTLKSFSPRPLRPRGNQSNAFGPKTFAPDFRHGAAAFVRRRVHSIAITLLRRFTMGTRKCNVTFSKRCARRHVNTGNVVIAKNGIFQKTRRCECIYTARVHSIAITLLWRFTMGTREHKI